MNFLNDRGMTRIEALIMTFLVIIILLLIPPAVLDIKSRIRDKARLSDMEIITKALQKSFVINNSVPASSGLMILDGNDLISRMIEGGFYGADGIKDPLHPNFNYLYQSIDGRSYLIRFCLENKSNGFKRGCNNEIKFDGI